MAFEDWTVEVTSIVPVPNTKPNPLTGKPIDPEGLTLSRFEMRLTHTPTGKVIERADLASLPTKQSLIAYARGVVDVAEANFAAAAAVGPLNIIQPAPAVETKEQKDLRVFQAADAKVATEAALVEKLKVIAPADASALQAYVDKLIAARNTAAAPVITAVKVAGSATK